MGIIHALRIQKVVADARQAYNEGDMFFGAGFDVPRGVSMRKIRKEIDLIISRVEPVGWSCVSVEPFFASVQIDFVRRG